MNITAGNKLYSLIYLLITCFITSFSFAESGEQSQHEKWFNQDNAADFIDVNEGELTFIQPVTDKNILHSDSIINLDQNSLKTGWVTLEQCYQYFDSVYRTEIVYRYKEVKQFKVTSSENIGEVKANGQTIQLRDVGQTSKLCISASVKILDKTENEGFKLTSGPYHRKFLDGYYPYHVSLTINYPSDVIKYSNISPISNELFKLKENPGQLVIETWFEGILVINIEFN